MSEVQKNDEAIEDTLLRTIGANGHEFIKSSWYPICDRAECFAIQGFPSATLKCPAEFGYARRTDGR